MSEKVSPIPEGFHTITPHMVVKGAAEAIAFYEEAFGAEELSRNLLPDGQSVMHASIRIGDSVVMLNDEFPDHGIFGPSKERPSSVTIHIYTDDVDALYERAQAAGCEVNMPLQDTFWGARYAVLRDPFGHSWSIASRIAEPSPEEVAKGAAAAFGGEGDQSCSE